MRLRLKLATGFQEPGPWSAGAEEEVIFARMFAAARKRTSARMHQTGTKKRLVSPKAAPVTVPPLGESLPGVQGW